MTVAARNRGRTEATMARYLATLIALTLALDVNFAHVSRRLFSKARTSEGLIEFRGRALANALVGLYSDDRGATRSIALRATIDDTICSGSRP